MRFGSLATAADPTGPTRARADPLVGFLAAPAHRVGGDPGRLGHHRHTTRPQLGSLGSQPQSPLELRQMRSNNRIPPRHRVGQIRHSTTVAPKPPKTTLFHHRPLAREGRPALEPVWTPTHAGSGDIGDLRQLSHARGFGVDVHSGEGRRQLRPSVERARVAKSTAAWSSISSPIERGQRLIGGSDTVDHRSIRTEQGSRRVAHRSQRRANQVAQPSSLVFELWGTRFPGSVDVPVRRRPRSVAGSRCRQEPTKCSVPTDPGHAVNRGAVVLIGHGACQRQRARISRARAPARPARTGRS